MISILIVGAGRMGSLIEHLALADDRFTVVGKVSRAGKETLSTLGKVADVVIDFSHPDMLPSLDAYIRRTGTALVSGTTGYTPQQQAQLQALGEWAPVLYSANYSIGVAVLRKLVSQAAASLGDDFDIELIETHHNQKADSPSGTAKLLLEAIDPGHANQLIYGREGMVGKRGKKEIGVHAVRGGTVAGEHTVAFFGPDEELKFTHRATSRQIFASGALKAAGGLISRSAGFYTIDDILFGEGVTP